MAILGKLYEGEVVPRKLVISGCDAAAVLDAFEERLDVVVVTIAARTEANRVPAVAFRRDICPCGVLSDKLPNDGRDPPERGNLSLIHRCAGYSAVHWAGPAE